MIWKGGNSNLYRLLFIDLHTEMTDPRDFERFYLTSYLVSRAFSKAPLVHNFEENSVKITGFFLVRVWISQSGKIFFVS